MSPLTFLSIFMPHQVKLMMSGIKELQKDVVSGDKVKVTERRESSGSVAFLSPVYPYCLLL